MNHTNRRPGKVSVSLLAGLIVGISGAVVDAAVIPWDRIVMVHQLIGDFIAGLVAALIALSLQLKQEEQHYGFAAERAASMAELNHHIRNAVFPLCLAVQRLGDAESNKVANEAVERINIALKDAAADAFSHRIEYGRVREDVNVRAA
jgi:hypothetical protein